MSDDVELRALSPFYRILFNDGATLDMSADAQAMREQIASLSPADVAGYERFLRTSREICDIGFERLGDAPFTRLMDMVRVAPDLMRVGAWRSVWSLVARHVKDERVRIALSFHPLFIGGNPFQASAIYALISWLERKWGVHYAMGGVGRLVDGLIGLIRSQGGALRLNCEVERILLSGRKATGVRLKNGEEIAADIVVSNADTAFTYDRLLPPGVSRWSGRKLQRARYSMSLFVWYFGVNRTYPDVPHHTIVMGPRYRELLDDIFERKTLADDFSLYLHRPTATDPSLAPPGCESFYVLSPVPNLDADVDWAQKAEPYRQAIARRLSETLLPGLEDSIVTSRMMTPLDFRDRLLSVKGAAFGLEPILTQSAWFRPHNRCEDVEGLYLVGAGTQPGAGLPGVLCSAKILDRLVPHANAHV
jgi:phytoene desaturase